MVGGRTIWFKQCCLWTICLCLHSQARMGYFATMWRKFLDDNEIRYLSHVKFSGKSGLDHLFDFVIPKSKKVSERILQVINSPHHTRIESFLFAAQDTKAGRGQDVSCYALINDSRKKLSPEMLQAFSVYDVCAFTWSHRDELVEKLAA